MLIRLTRLNIVELGIETSGHRNPFHVGDLRRKGLDPCRRNERQSHLDRLADLRLAAEVVLDIDRCTTCLAVGGAAGAAASGAGSELQAESTALIKTIAVLTAHVRIDMHVSFSILATFVQEVLRVKSTRRRC